MPAQISIFSLFYNASEQTKYDVYILFKEGELISDDQNQFNELRKIYPQHHIRFLSVKSFFDGGFEIRNITQTCYYRLMIPQLIQQINEAEGAHYDRVLYLDVDTIIGTDLSELYNTLLSEVEYVAGVCESQEKYDEVPPHFKMIDCDPMQYINSGVLIMDTSKLLKINFTQNCESHKDKQYACQDQDIINIVLKGHIALLLYKYNMTSILYRRQIQMALPESFITNRCIVHYTGEKPWNTSCIRDFVWWYYYAASPYFNAEFYFKHFASLQTNRVACASVKQLFQELKNRILHKFFGYSQL